MFPDIAAVTTVEPTTNTLSLVAYTCDCRACGRVIYLTPQAYEKLNTENAYVHVADCASPLPEGAIYIGFVGEHRLFCLPDPGIPVTTEPDPEEETPRFNLFDDGDFDLI